MSQHRLLTILVLLGFVLVTACTTALPVGEPTLVGPANTSQPTSAPEKPTVSEPTPNQTPQTSAVTEPAATVAPEPPTATIQPEVASDGKDISADGISFFLPATVAADSIGSAYKVKPVTADTPFWEKMPDHFLFLFKGYQQTNSMHQPRIYIWPIAEYINANPSFEATVTLLKSLLSQKTTVDLSTAELPFPPIFNAGKVVSLLPEFLELKNGSGLRYLTFFSQATMPITNQGLFYTFQGITADEKYYINAVLPISQADIPADDSSFQIDTAFYDHYETYLAQVQSQIAEAPTDSFKPDLPSLDGMISSLEVSPVITGQTVYSQYADFYKGSILLNSTLGLDWEENNSEATAGDGSEMPMSIHPYLGGINFTGYPLQDQFHQPRIITFDLAEYLAMDPRPQTVVDDLKAILAAEDQPIPADGKLPFFPMFPANQVFHTQAKILHHQNGSGLRYLTMYSQAYLAVDNFSLFYTYQGLSTDGKTYVIVILPIHASTLKDKEGIPEDTQAFIDNYAKYLSDISAGLNALIPEQFTPNLDEIDHMIETIRLW